LDDKADDVMNEEIIVYEQATCVENYTFVNCDQRIILRSRQ